MRALVLVMLLAARALAQAPDAGVPVDAASAADAGDAGPLDAPVQDTAQPVPVTQPEPTPKEPPIPPSRRGCHTLYAQPSLVFGGSTGGIVVPGPLIARTAFGFRVCTPDVAVHAGLVFDIATNASWGLVGMDRYLAYGYLGWGGEARVAWPVGSELRIGPRLSVISDKGVWGRQTHTALWIGARVETEPVIFGVDFVHVFDYYSNEEISKRANGIYGSVSLRGMLGSVIGGVAIVVLGLAIKIAPDHSS